MRSKLVPPCIRFLGSPFPLYHPKVVSLSAMPELLPLNSYNPCSSLIFRTVIASNTFSAFEYSPCKLQFILDRRPYSIKHAKFSRGSGWGVWKSFISTCSSIWDKKADTILENYSSLQEILKIYGDLCPEVTRRFWRVSELRPEDLLEILLSFQPSMVSMSAVEFLWILFRWTPMQSKDFHHLPRSYEIMVSMLIQFRMHAYAEALLLSSDPSAVFPNPSKVCSEIIQGYVDNFLLQNAVALYDQARNRGLELSCSCYQALLNHLVKTEKSELTVRVYVDMLESKFGLCAEDRFLNFTVGYLSKNGKTLDAVNILRQARTAGLKKSPAALDAVVQGYCCKKDFEDVLNLCKEWVYIPSSSVCNRVISSICKELGSDYSWFFTQELEALGFQLDDITLGVLIVQSCRERKLREAFIYLSESFSRGIKLKVHVYNALIGGVLNEGMCNSAKDILDEMVERGILLDLSTFKIILAGYFKYRKFDAIYQLLAGMVNSGFISLAPVEDPLSKAFTIIGLNCLEIKVKRDNDAKVPRAEYFDCLGNGLYFETDTDEYTKFLEKILDTAMSPDFDSILFKECLKGNIDSALRVKDEVAQWGHDLFPLTCSEFVKLMCSSPSHVKEAVCFLDENTKKWEQLGCETLNLVIQSLSKNGMAVSARSILYRLLKSGLLVPNASYTAVIMGFYKEKNLQGIQEYLEFLEGLTYLPCSKDFKILVSCLCKSGMVKEMIIFFDSMTEKYPSLVPTYFTDILNVLSSRRLASIRSAFVEKIFKRSLVRDHAFLIHLAKTTSPKSYRFLLHFLVRSGRIEEAMYFKKQILSRRVSHANFVYSILLKIFCIMGKSREVTFLLQEMLANIVFPNATALNALVQEFCQQNNLSKALEVLGIMLRSQAGLSISSYRCLVRQLCVHRLLNGALNLQKLIQLETKLNSLIFHNVLIFSLFQTSNSLLVNALLENMLEKKLIQDTSTYNFLVFGYYKSGNVPKAVEVFYDMIFHGIRPNNRSLRTIICYFCSNGEIRKALELSNMMVTQGWKHGSCVQNSLALGLISCGELSEALLLLDCMEDQGLIPERIYYDHLIKELSVQGKMKKAVHLLNLMLKKGNLPCQSTYSSVIHGLCVHQAFNEALDFHVEMLHKGLVPNVASTDALIQGLTDCGRTDDARRILGSMLQFGLIPACSLYNYVIRRFYTENNALKASELVQEMQQVGYSPNFETQWSLISSLSSSTRKDDQKNKGFLSALLSWDSPLKIMKDKRDSST